MAKGERPMNGWALPGVAAAALASAVVLSTPAGAQFSVDDPSATGVPTDVDPADQTAAVVEPIAGFRSAAFDMTADEVFGAIFSDFGLGDDAVTVEPNLLERTTAMSITVEDLLPGTGLARVVYILGYQSQRLIQVNVIWGAPIDAEYAPEALVAAASMLQGFFAGRAWAPDTAFANVQLTDGTIVVFTGQDGDGRQVTLTYRDEAAAAEPASEEAAEDAGAEDAGAEDARNGFLRLSYVEDPANPDVFRIQPGDF